MSGWTDVSDTDVSAYRTFRPRMFQPRMFRTGLFSGVDVSDRFFLQKVFFYVLVFNLTKE